MRINGLENFMNRLLMKLFNKGIRYVNVYKFYQDDCRVYLDEYPEQERLREEWLYWRENSKFVNSYFKVIFNCPSTYTNSNYLYIPIDGLDGSCVLTIEQDYDSWIEKRFMEVK